MESELAVLAPFDRAHVKRSETGRQSKSGKIKPWKYNQGSLGIIYLIIFQHCLGNYMLFRGITKKHFTRGKNDDGISLNPTCVTG